MRWWSARARAAASWPRNSARPACRSCCWSAAIGSSFGKHGHDELINQRTTGSATPSAPTNGSPRVVETGPGRWRTVMPSEGGYSNNAACVGSGTVSYGAMAWRYHGEGFPDALDLRRAGGLDAGRLADQLRRPGAVLRKGRVGDRRLRRHERKSVRAPPRRSRYPMPPFPYNREGRLLEAAAKRLGLHPFPIPMLRNSVPYGGRNACIAHAATASGFACPINAKNGTHNTVIPGRWPRATASCAPTASPARSSWTTAAAPGACAIRRAATAPQYQTAISSWSPAAAIETARLLLNSKSRLFPNGAGNRHDWVGRNLQGHAYSGACGLFAEETL